MNFSNILAILVRSFIISNQNAKTLKALVKTTTTTQTSSKIRSLSVATCLSASWKINNYIHYTYTENYCSTCCSLPKKPAWISKLPYNWPSSTILPLQKHLEYFQVALELSSSGEELGKCHSGILSPCWAVRLQWNI